MNSFVLWRVATNVKVFHHRPQYHDKKERDEAAVKDAKAPLHGNNTFQNNDVFLKIIHVP